MIEKCFYKVEQWEENYQYPNYLGTWNKVHTWYQATNNKPRDEEHRIYKVFKLKKPINKEYLPL